MVLKPLDEQPFLNPEPPNRPQQRWLLVVVLPLVAGILLCVGILVVVLLPAPITTPVTVIVADMAYQLDTQATTVNDVLRELNVVLGEGDTVSPAPETPVTANLLVRVDHIRTVTLTVDGETQTLQTAFSNPFDILKSTDVTVGEHDRVLVDGTPATVMDLLVWPVPVTSLTIRRAMTVEIDDDGQMHQIETTSNTVGEALFEAGVTVYLGDTVTPEINTPLKGDTTIFIQRSRPVTIVADGVSLETRSQGATIASALADAGVTLQGLDYTIPADTSPLRPGIVIRVIRVTEQVDIEQETLPFETIYQEDPNLELDQKLVIQEGQNGVRQTNVRVRYENGIEVSRTPENTTTASEPLNRVIAYGTQIVLRTVDTPDGPREYWRKLRMYATIYYPEALGGDAVTATGRQLTKGVVGSDPKIIPYDSQLYVPGYGVGIMADTGILPHPMWIDLGYDDDNWVPWSRWVDVYLLTPVPANFDYLLPEVPER